MEKGFIKADSSNLPKVDSQMITEFLVKNANYFSAEMRNIKANRSSRENYGDNAVGYVQLKKEGGKCYLYARVTPEHKVNKKPYTVHALIDETNEEIVICECKDCAASAGGCKHAIAFLFWLHRRSEEPSVTSVTCYWKKSTLSKIGTIDFDIESIFNVKNKTNFEAKDAAIVEAVVSSLPNKEGALFLLEKENDLNLVSLYHLSLKYADEVKNEQKSEIHFINFCSTVINDEMCIEAEKATRKQSECKEWLEYRFGRITASKLYEAANCNTISGSLVEVIMGSSGKFQTEAVTRGQKLETEVLKKVAKKKRIKVTRPGIFLSSLCPIFGASPDGVSEEYCLEIKCPFKNKTVENYIKNDIVQKKYMCQIQLQMLLCKKHKGLFCVAAPDFETSSNVKIIEVNFDEKLLKDVMEKAEDFWKKAIYPLLIKN